MPIFSGKDVVVCFTVDYSLAFDGRMTVYEIQSACSDHTLRGRDAKDGRSLDDANNQEKIWFDYFKQQHPKAYFVDLPNRIDGDKAAQRLLLESDERTKEFNPRFVIIENVRQLDVAKIQQFISTHESKVVIKGDGSMGSANVFTRNLSAKSSGNEGISQEELVGTCNSLLAVSRTGKLVV